MLKVFSAPFQSAFEDAFKKNLFKLKENQPFLPILIVAPSSRILERLQILGAEGDRPLLNVHFHNFDSLAKEIIYAESRLSKPVLKDSLFYDTVVKDLLDKESFFPDFEELALPEGFPPAVRSTLRDLLDAGINEDQVEEAIREEFLGRSVDLGTLRTLLHLYRMFLKKLDSLPFLHSTQVVKEATSLAESSVYLKKFHEIIYYGFYDLTGLQWDFFERVVKNHSSTFYFPYSKENSAYGFAKSFRDVFLQQVMHEEIELEKTNQANIPAQIINVSGLADEAWVLAKEILRLHQEKNIPFSEIAVVARNKDRLSGVLASTLRGQLIPVKLPSVHSLLKTSQAQACLNLLELGAHAPLSAADIDFMSHPEWIGDSSNKIENLVSFPTKASWREFIKISKELISKTFLVDSEKTKPIWNLIIETCESLSSLDLIRSSISIREFLDTLRDRWSRSEYVVEPGVEAGVSLLYAEAARFLPFQVVFIIGMEEKVFPRVVREDPFLRDDARLAIHGTLGHKIASKLAGLDEEKLLFEILKLGAKEQLFITYQRSDDDGAVVGPSSFLNGLTDSNVLSVPRSHREKWINESPLYSGFHDVVRGFLASGKNDDALQFAKAFDRDVESLSHGIQVRKQLDSFGLPGAYDGLVGKRELSDYSKEFSATSIEKYGQCPFQFFAERILKLSPLEEFGKDELWRGDEKGTAIHLVLEKFYLTATDKGAIKVQGPFPLKLFEDAFDSVFSEINETAANIHSVLWDVLKFQIKEKLKIYLLNDWTELLESGYSPVYIEKEFRGSIPEISSDLVWVGKMDRIDQKGDDYRVIDYKTGRTKKPASVSLGARRGFRSQAPLYLAMLDKLLKSKKNLSFQYLYPFSDEEKIYELSSKDWVKHKEDYFDVIRTQIAEIKQGVFVIMPEDSYCSYCPVASICRKNHGLSVYRSLQGPGEKLWDLRKAGERS
jgi:ATP-dependent helicase/DNAse subunit B